MLTLPRTLAAAALWAVALPAQSPAPAAEVSIGGLRPAWLDEGARLLEEEDPLAAWRVFLAARPGDDEVVERRLGLGRADLMLGRARSAVAQAEEALMRTPTRQDAMALTVRALIRARRFDDALGRSRRYLERAAAPTAELLAARGSSLFRVQRTSDAGAVYQRVVALDHEHAEGHLRLGSGLLGPVVVDVPDGLRAAVRALEAGARARAIEQLHGVLAAHPAHPIAHRLLGESLFALRTAACMALRDASFQQVALLAPPPETSVLPIAEFVPAYRGLSPKRRSVVERTAALFASRLDKLLRVGGRHDLLTELERTTDDASREGLRGRRTFDGRVWDDVRGVGGLRAATGVEALDEAAAFGFDTFAHEVAHQVHFFTFTPLERAKLRALYKAAMTEDRCLDYYAASNEAEYFGQGVEAFVSLAKRPGGETTHGHTRWELKRVDPELYAFVAEVVDYDPLHSAARRAQLLEAAAEAALRCGRPADVRVVAAMMEPSDAQRQLARSAAELAAELK